MSNMSTVRKATDALNASTDAYTKAHEAKLARHRAHLAQLKREREMREAEMVAQIVEGQSG